MIQSMRRTNTRGGQSGPRTKARGIMARTTPSQLQAILDNGLTISSDSPSTAKQIGVVKHKEELIPVDPYTGPESELQKDAEKYLDAKRYIYLHMRNCRGNRAGWPDLTVLLPNGRVVFVELKVKGGRLSAEQKEFRSKAIAGGHIYRVCYNIEQVIATIITQEAT